MKKVALLLALIMVLMIPVSAQAVTPRAANIIPSITYSGAKATCSVQIVDGNPSNYIEATIKFWKGTVCLETWEVSGYGVVIFSDTATALKGCTYKLTVDATVNGVKQQTVTYSKKYE